MKCIERVRLYPTAVQERRLAFMLDVTRELYNALPQQRRDAYRLRRVRVSAKEQYAEITALRKPAHWIDGVKLRKGRAVPRYGRAWVITRNGRWYACFECERAACALPKTGKMVGIDRGVHVLAALSDGTLMRNLGVGERRKAATARLQREANARRDHAHKLARHIVNSADVIALEKLRLGSMTRSAKGTDANPGRNVAAKRALNRRMLDAGFGLLRQMIVAKAEEAARTVVEVDCRFSSQECSRCGHVARESRRRRRFACVVCGYESHADVNAALVIRRRAQLALMSELQPAEDAGRQTRCAA